VSDPGRTLGSIDAIDQIASTATREGPWATGAEEWIRKRVFQSFEDSPAGHVAGLAQLLAPIQPDLVVSDDAIGGSPVQPRQAQRSKFADACDATPRGSCSVGVSTGSSRLSHSPRSC
jgi:hypothetical protein